MVAPIVCVRAGPGMVQGRGKLIGEGGARASGCWRNTNRLAPAWG
ncbi:hypothetical protein [Pseudomonas sp. MPFS]|nr:hypothetical protein [Pseudomonas sp. MPFS]